MDEGDLQTTLRVMAHALRGSITTLLSVTSRLGSPDSESLQRSKKLATKKLRELAAVADALEALAQRKKTRL